MPRPPKDRHETLDHLAPIEDETLRDLAQWFTLVARELTESCKPKGDPPPTLVLMGEEPQMIDISGAHATQKAKERFYLWDLPALCAEHRPRAVGIIAPAWLGTPMGMRHGLAPSRESRRREVLVCELAASHEQHGWMAEIHRRKGRSPRLGAWHHQDAHGGLVPDGLRRALLSSYAADVEAAAAEEPSG